MYLSHITVRIARSKTRRRKEKSAKWTSSPELLRAKIVLGAAIAFLIFSFFEMVRGQGQLGEAAEALGADNGINACGTALGYLAGLLAIVLASLGRRFALPISSSRSASRQRW